MLLKVARWIFNGRDWSVRRYYRKKLGALDGTSVRGTLQDLPYPPPSVKSRFRRAVPTPSSLSIAEIGLNRFDDREGVRVGQRKRSVQ